MASVKVNYAKDGSVISYRLRADLGRDTQGKQIVKTRTIKSSGALTPKKELREMQRQADEWERSMKEGLAPVQEKTFKQFVEIDFFQVHVHSGELKESTMEFYRNMAPRTIDYFGNMELTKIGSLDIEKFLNSLRTVTQENGKPLSASTVRHYYSFLKILFNFAEKHDLLIKNPMLKISPPKIKKKPVEFFSQQEAKEFLSILGTAPLQWQALMTTLILTGLRRGEAVGLQWQDISFTNGDLSVKRNVVYTPSSGIVVGTPKTSTALRTIPLPDSLLGLLKRWQKEQYGPYGGMLLPNAFVFSDAATPYEPLRPDRITRWLRRFEQSHGLRQLSPHDLRHSCASLLLSGGATLKATQAILGHADASTTLDFYAGVTQENLRKETDKLKDVLGL